MPNAVVIPNGADLPSPAEPPDAPAEYLLYFGALQPWQGVDTALRALQRLPVELVICASVHPRRAKPLRKLAENLGVADRVHWHFALPEAELARFKQHARLSLAPLKDCSRNVVQGCSPLKILESMAAGVPVVASDLPPTRELIEDGVNGRLVAADRPGELARAIRVLLDHPERGRAARRERPRAHRRPPDVGRECRPPPEPLRCAAMANAVKAAYNALTPEQRKIIADQEGRGPQAPRRVAGAARPDRRLRRARRRSPATASSPAASPSATTCTTGSGRSRCR